MLNRLENVSYPNSSIDSYDLHLFYSNAETADKGFISERDFEDIIYDDIQFDITPDEMDQLCDEYGKEAKRGYVDFKDFENDIQEINDKHKAKMRVSMKDLRDEEPEVKELPISYRTSPNMPSDHRYSMKNTVVGRFPDSRTQRKHEIRLNQGLMEDIIKETYLRDVLIEDAFMAYGKGVHKTLTSADLREAFTDYGINVDKKSNEDIYNRLMGDAESLTATLIDLAIEDNCLKSIEEIQKTILSRINHALKENPNMAIKEAFMKFDFDGTEIVTFEQFAK